MDCCKLMDDTQRIEIDRVAVDVLAYCIAAAKRAGFSLFKCISEDRISKTAARNFFYLTLAHACAEPYAVKVTVAAAPVVAKIGAAAYFLCQYVMSVDDVVDRHHHALLVDGTAALMLALEQLRDAAPSAVVFNELQRAVLGQLRSTLSTVEMEKQQGPTPCCWNYQRYAQIAVQKCSMANIVPLAIARCAATATADKSDVLYRAQVDALSHVHIGMQWIDDLADVAEDRDFRQPSLLLSRLGSWCKTHQIEIQSVDDIRLRKLAYVSGIAAQALNEAINEFNEAKACVKDTGMGLFTRNVDVMIAHQSANVVAIKKSIQRALIVRRGSRDFA